MASSAAMAALATDFGNARMRFPLHPPLGFRPEEPARRRNSQAEGALGNCPKRCLAICASPLARRRTRPAVQGDHHAAAE
jgi:hypothetical protein